MADAANKKVYIDVNRKFVKTGISYKNKETGLIDKFNSVTIPRGTVVDGRDVSYYQFTPLFVNDSKYLGENYCSIPLIADREVWLMHDQLDEQGHPVLDETGRKQKDVVKVMPTELKRALDANRKQYFDQLNDRADRACMESEALNGSSNHQAETQVV